jgi:succinate-semialdehyde dehydrogenase/glutarate-semialdehyde dehydrogenase
MPIESRNPTTGKVLKTLAGSTPGEVGNALARTSLAAPVWARTAFAERARWLYAVASLLRRETDRLGRLATLEMGKPIREARAEVEKCVWGCEYFAGNAERLLQEETVATDATKSLVTYPPLGTVLGIMPWNFPFWQVFRAAVPALMAGNTFLLKHASNVPQCALAIDALFKETGLAPGVFETLLISGEAAEGLLADARVHAVTLTGSEPAGRRVAAAAGSNLKKSVLELGGSDPFVVLEDADLELTAAHAVHARFQNTGQSCIAAKRFVLIDSIADDFLKIFKEKISNLKVGDPLEEETQLGPLARADLREALHAQVRNSQAQGATLILGGKPLAGPGYFYEPTVLDNVTHGTRAYTEELFGPVVSVIRVKNETEALNVANDTRFGLGGSVWTQNIERGETFARLLQCGLAFVNGTVKSDPRLPFGGIKASGYGRELSMPGIREFVNVKTLWVR